MTPFSRASSVGVEHDGEDVAMTSRATSAFSQDPRRVARVFRARRGVDLAADVSLLRDLPGVRRSVP
jgi:hypothetical protein